MKRSKKSLIAISVCFSKSTYGIPLCKSRLNPQETKSSILSFPCPNQKKPCIKLFQRLVFRIHHSAGIASKNPWIRLSSFVWIFVSVLVTFLVFHHSILANRSRVTFKGFPAEVQHFGSDKIVWQLHTQKNNFSICYLFLSGTCQCSFHSNPLTAFLFRFRRIFICLRYEEFLNKF